MKKIIFGFFAMCLGASIMCMHQDCPRKMERDHELIAFDDMALLTLNTPLFSGLLNWATPFIQSSISPLFITGTRRCAQTFFTLNLHKKTELLSCASKVGACVAASPIAIYFSAKTAKWMRSALVGIFDPENDLWQMLAYIGEPLKPFWEKLGLSKTPLTSSLQYISGAIPTVSRLTGITFGAVSLGCLAYLGHRIIANFKNHKSIISDHMNMQTADEIKNTDQIILPSFLSEYADRLKAGTASGDISETKGCILIDGPASLEKKQQLVGEFARRIGDKVPVYSITYQEYVREINSGKTPEDCVKTIFGLIKAHAFAFNTPCMILCLINSAEWEADKDNKNSEEFSKILSELTQTTANKDFAANNARDFERSLEPDEFLSRGKNHPVSKILHFALQTGSRCVHDMSEILRRPMLLIGIESPDQEGVTAAAASSDSSHLFRIIQTDQHIKAENAPTGLFSEKTRKKFEKTIKIENFQSEGLEKWPGKHPHAIETIAKKFTDPQTSNRTASHILLYGKPGSGKTKLIRALAGTIEAPIVRIDVANMSPENFKVILNELKRQLGKKSSKPIIVLLDDIDLAIFEQNSLLGQLLRTELDGFENDDKKLIVVITTNSNPTNEEYQALTRNGRLEPIELLLPDETDRAAILHYHIERLAPKNTVSTDIFNQLITNTKGWTPAELSNIIEKSVNWACNENCTLSDAQIKKGFEEITEQRNSRQSLESSPASSSKTAVKKVKKHAPSLPTFDERVEIFASHFPSHSSDVHQDQIQKAAELTENWSKAELQNILKQSTDRAHANLSDLSMRMVLEVLEEAIKNDSKEIEQHLPTPKERIGILIHYIFQLAYDTGVRLTPEYLKKLAEKTEGWTSKDLEYLIQQAISEIDKPTPLTDKELEAGFEKAKKHKETTLDEPEDGSQD